MENILKMFKIIKKKLLIQTCVSWGYTLDNSIWICILSKSEENSLETCNLGNFPPDNIWNYDNALGFWKRFYQLYWI